MPDQVPAFFSERPSPFDHVDARAKLLMAMCVIGFLFLAPTWPWLAGLLAVGIAASAVARFRFKWLATLWLIQLPNVVGLMLLPSVLNLIEGDFAVSDLDDGLRMSFAWLGAVSVLTPLLWTMSIDEITDGLRGLKVPRSVTFAVGYAFRLLNVSLNGMLQTIDALKAKGVDMETRNPRALLAALPKLMVPAVFLVVRRANAMMAVLRMRGLSAAADQPLLRLQRIDAVDVAFVAAGVFAVALPAASRFSLVAV
jgi:energy-coupling factor transport system permease protein